MYRYYVPADWRDVPCVALFSGTYTISASDYGSCREITEEMKIPLEESRRGFNATLINDPYFVEPILQLALQLKPEAEHLALVSDTWQIGYMVRNITCYILIYFACTQKVFCLYSKLILPVPKNIFGSKQSTIKT